MSINGDDRVLLRALAESHIKSQKKIAEIIETQSINSEMIMNLVLEVQRLSSEIEKLKDK